jgi:regulator of CtrA degradation
MEKRMKELILMKAKGDNSGNRGGGEGLIDFLARFTASDQFAGIFKEGMGLVEETANYLDGPGRQDARILDRTGAIAYATESMRLTTRLMQLASWLLLQRAVSAGEISFQDASREKHRINLSEIGAGHTLTGYDQIPLALKDLVDRSLRLHERILKLDEMVSARAETAPQPSPVSHQMDRLAAVFKVAQR